MVEVVETLTLALLVGQVVLEVVELEQVGHLKPVERLEPLILVVAVVAIEPIQETAAPVL